MVNAEQHDIADFNVWTPCTFDAWAWYQNQPPFEVYMLAGEPRLYFLTIIKSWGEVVVKDSWDRFGPAQIGVVFNERTEALNARLATRVRERKLPQGRGQG